MDKVQEHLSFENQLSLFESRGMLVTNREKAVKNLKRLVIINSKNLLSHYQK
ncbi:hypothetical protein [Enterococcus sp. AZ101]|uniref:hypothetical protein n=1 Tax=unclassified Enterococcus TaxID=2608891 RepID=UPI003D2BFBFA